MGVLIGTVLAWRIGRPGTAIRAFYPRLQWCDHHQSTGMSTPVAEVARRHHSYAGQGWVSSIGLIGVRPSLLEEPSAAVSHEIGDYRCPRWYG